jgi:hypothetical protein
MIFVSAMLILGGLSSYGQTNVPPAVSKTPPLLPPLPPVSTNAASGFRDPSLTRVSKAQKADTGLFRRIGEENLLKPSTPGKNYNVALESIFQSDNEWISATPVRDTYVTIYPTGK